MKKRAGPLFVMRTETIELHNFANLFLGFVTGNFSEKVNNMFHLNKLT